MVIAEKIKGLMKLGILLSSVGIIFLFFNVSMGTSLADSWLISQGEFADSSLYELKRSGYSISFLTAGGILFGVGLSATILTYYKLLMIKE